MKNRSAIFLLLFAAVNTAHSQNPPNTKSARSQTARPAQKPPAAASGCISQGQTGPSIDETVKYINDLLDSGLGVKNINYVAGHMMIDCPNAVILWSRAIYWKDMYPLGCRDEVQGDYACYHPGFELDFIQAKAVDLGTVTAEKDDQGNPVVQLTCAGEQSHCLTFRTLKEAGDIRTFYQADWVALKEQMLGRSGTESPLHGLQIMTTNDGDDRSRLVRALQHLIELVKGLPGSKANDPFAK